METNYYDSDKDGTLNGSELGVDSTNYGGMDLVTEKFDYPAVATVLSPDDALTYVTKCKLHFHKCSIGVPD